MHVWKRFLACCALVSLPAWAAPKATVEAVQMPAWIEQAGQTRPLAVGMGVGSGDRIRTGAGARAYLKLAEGSTVKLGENAKLAFFSHSLQPQTQFKGVLDVLSGAFRFTTAAAQRVRSRELLIRVGTATAGIRGTDLWGRSDAQEDLICLIDGRIEIWHAAVAGSIAMAQPMTFLVAPRGAAPAPVAAVNPEEFRKWARQTEIVAGDGTSRQGGNWKLLLGRHAAAGDALAQYDAARAAGYAARIRPLAAEAGWHYEVLLAGFADAAEATATAARLKAATGIEASAAR